MSSGSESDDEYVPGEPEQLSEEDSANEETDQQYEKEQTNKALKRKAVDEKNTKQKRKTLRNSTIEEDESKDDRIENVNLDPEEEKKREEDLWAKFLEGTDTKPKTQEQSKLKSMENAVTESKTKIEQKPEKEETGKRESAEEKERRIFEFAGETIIVENNIIKEKIKTADVTATASKPNIPARNKGAGLSNLVGQLNKKNKLSTLEKTKLDWDTFKKEEGIEDDLKTHNKGKAGYLDRQDFLERADVRQYEIERDLRQSRRSHR